ncbi:helix-turn-helix domain-containing protein [Methylobacillus caricis]|uniref:transcriptional regulator n=1 Tax=Methylobacillus caricis TaxID=1971611 RepID=UPI001CFF9DFD|nr:helix-turn-helix domain-containing protein [Methylobacillus caricis]
MTLSEYLLLERGRVSSLAKAIGAHAPDVSRWARDKSDKNHRSIPVKFGPKIEKATGHQVTRQELFDNWQDLWPELAHSSETTNA